MGADVKKKMTGNFADLNLSKNNSEESDGGLEFDTGAKADTFQFSNQNKSRIGGGNFTSKLKAPSSAAQQPVQNDPPKSIVNSFKQKLLMEKNNS